MTAFKAMGSNAVPFLIDVVQTKPSKLSQVVDDKLYKDDLARRVPEGVTKALPSAMRTEQRREFAVFLIEQIGPQAAAAIPTLMTILSDQSEGWRIEAGVRGALIAMGEELVGQVPQFLEYLKSENRATQQLGAVLLEATGPGAKAAVPTLLKLAESHDWWVSLSVAGALWNIDRQTNVAVNVYTNSLQSTNSTDRELALIHLRKMGTAAKAAGPQVQVALRDPDSVVRKEAETTLREIDPDLLELSQQNINQKAPTEVANLIQTIQSGDFQARFQALEVLPVFGPDAKPAVPVLIEVLTQPGPVPAYFAAIGLANSRRNAAEALAEIGPGARAAVPALINLLTGRTDHNAAIYCRALGLIGPGANEAAPALEAAMRDENRGIRLAAATALTRISPAQSSNAAEVLRALQSDPELAAVWSVDKNGIATRTRQLDFNNPASRFFKLAASVPLWGLGLEKEPPVTAILNELKDPLSLDQTAYIEMLGDIGPNAKEALPTLCAFVGPQRFSRLRRAAAIAIRKIDPVKAVRLGLPGILVVP